MNDIALEKLLKHYAIPRCFQWLHSPLNWKYCAWLFQLITLRDSVSVQQMLYLFAVMCGKTNVNLMVIYLSYIYISTASSGVSFCSVGNKGQQEKFYIVVKSMARKKCRYSVID